MPAERLLIHTRGSHSSGYGHVVRCMTLAKAARERGVDTLFVSPCPDTQQILEDLRVQWTPAVEGTSRWVLRDLPGGSDAADVRNEAACGARVLLLDDTGPARCEAALVVDAMMTPPRAHSLPHSDSTEYLYGLEYTALRESILDCAGTARPGSGQRLLIALGHGFDEGLLSIYLRALAGSGFAGRLELLFPQSADPSATLHADVAALGGTLWHGRDDIGPLLAGADLVVTKLGMTQLEAFVVGVGCLTLEPGEAHLAVQNALAMHYEDWPAVEMGLVAQLTPEQLAEQTVALLEDKQRLQTLGQRATALVDGQGARRVLDRLLEGRP